MPRPSSVTRIRLRPPAPISTVTLRGLGIQGVLDEFLDHAGGPLHHFAGGDLVGHLFGQQLDAVHGDDKSHALRQRQREGEKNRAAAGLAPHPDAAAMIFDNLFANGQAQARAVFLAVGAERLKQPARDFRRNARPGVLELGDHFHWPRFSNRRKMGRR